jgi:hypothetical protein
MILSGDPRELRELRWAGSLRAVAVRPVPASPTSPAGPPPPARPLPRRRRFCGTCRGAQVGSVSLTGTGRGGATGARGGWMSLRAMAT